MKKSYLFLFALIAFNQLSKGQAVASIDAPPYNGDFSAFVGPNGINSGTNAVSYSRSCYLVTQSELARLALTNSVVTNFGLDIFRPGSVPVTGQFTVYIENTSDATYLKGTNWANIVAGLTPNYTGNLILPTGSQNATTSVNVPLTSNFTYTGGGIYVTMDWYTAAPTSTLYTRYLTSFDNGANMGANMEAPAAGPAPTTLTVDIRRPVMRFSAANTATNEVGVVSIKAPGTVSKLITPGSPVSAVIRNNSVNALNGVPVTLSISGPNAYNNTQNVNISAGGTVNVVFSGYNPTNNGLSNMTITVAPDQFAGNDSSAVWQQTVTCAEYGNHPPLGAGVFSDGSYGYGGQAIIATPLNPASTASITGIKFAPSQSPQGNYSICGVLLDSFGGIIAMTNTVNLTAASFGNYANLTFNPALELTGGTNYFYGIAQLNGNVFPFGTLDVLQKPATTNLNLYFTVPIVGGSIGGAQNQMGYLGMQAVLGFSNTTITAYASQTLICKHDGPNTVTLTAEGLTTYTWAPGGQGASIAVTPTVSGANGGVTYNVTGTDGPSGCKSKATAVTVSVSACTALSSNTSDGYNINVFPNPSVGGKSTITGLAGTNVITVFNLLGQSVLRKVVSEGTFEMDLSNQPSGNYLVKIVNSNNESRMVKVINQNN